MLSMKPVDKKESAIRGRFASPHDVFENHDQGMRIAKKRWKRHRSHYMRRQATKAIKGQTDQTAA